MRSIIICKYWLRLILTHIIEIRASNMLTTEITKLGSPSHQLLALSEEVQTQFLSIHLLVIFQILHTVWISLAEETAHKTSAISSSFGDFEIFCSEIPLLNQPPESSWKEWMQEPLEGSAGPRQPQCHLLELPQQARVAALAAAETCVLRVMEIIVFQNVKYPSA